MEFKKLSAVEAVEAVGDSANVLIEENGVIKKAPKIAVGGGEVDMIITITGTKYDKPTTDMITITKGSQVDIYNAIREGRIPDVRIRFMLSGPFDNGNGVQNASADELKATTHVYAESIFISCVYRSYSIGAGYIYSLSLSLSGIEDGAGIDSIGYSRVACTAVS